MPSGRAVKPATSCAPRPARRSRSTPTSRAGSCSPTASRTPSSCRRRASRRLRDAHGRDRRHLRRHLRRPDGPTTLVRGCRGGGDDAGELVWRLPLHPTTRRRRGPLRRHRQRDRDPQGGLDRRRGVPRRFTGDVPWAHVDIAGTANDAGKPYARKGGNGFGVRLILELAHGVAPEAKAPPQIETLGRVHGADRSPRVPEEGAGTPWRGWRP